MRRSVSLIVLIFAASVLNAQAPASPLSEEKLRWDRVSQDLRRFCHACHGPWRREGDVDLSALETPAKLRAQPDLIRNVAGLIASGEMPPADRLPRPDAATQARMAEDLKWLSARVEGPADPGRPTLRRLNRIEYRNTVRDLLGLGFDPATRFPQEASAYGFDNVGDALFLDPTTLEKYFDATEELIAAIDASPKDARRVYSDPTGDRRVWTRELLRRAFRRPPTKDEVEARESIARDVMRDRVAARAKASDSADSNDDEREGRRAILASVLLSPHFLYRVEAERPDDLRDGSLGWSISDHELATRLSYFLWSTAPDARLRKLADAGKLRNADVLRAEVDRMIDAPRFRAFAENFAGQWIGFRDILKHAVDFRRFKGFNDPLKRDLHEEGVLFFLALFRENLTASTIFDADFAFVNKRLAKHYGLPPVKGMRLRRVPLKDESRGGVLGMGSVLTLTSYPLRTSPVLRGRWILETLLDAPPPPPPPEAGELPADDRQKDGLTLRERLELHRKEPRCASCHARIDPLGFALESFDGVGRLRKKDQKKPVDDRALLPDGTEIRGPRGLKRALHDRFPDVQRALLKALMVYAWGRPLSGSDERFLAEARRRVEADDDGLRSYLHAVIMSHPFRHRRAPLPEDDK